MGGVHRPSGGYDALVLAGGAGRRLGGPSKPDHAVGGRSMLARVVAAVATADRVVVVGPTRPRLPAVTWCREDPAGGGPVAAIAAGLPLLDAPVTLLLAADLPFVGPGVPLLLAALTDTGGPVALMDASGRINYLAAAWPTARLRHVVDSIDQPAGAPVRALGVPVGVPDPAGWGDDCDTPEQLAAARERAAGEERA